ncbi:MAG: hypothetical protein HYR56_31570 [Acidobacteria bacterium]|nr:hypothetical protein [Acidobacteriota bacterium]MBI3425947.1 hypothetical protein [Acidobacteriota bacterium]
MTTISIIPEHPVPGEIIWRAVAGDKRSQGKTMGEALDALAAQLALDESEARVIVGSKRPDQFFSAAQQQRLAALMAQWRMARDTGQQLPPHEQLELEALIEAEVQGAGRRAEQALLDLAP